MTPAYHGVARRLQATRQSTAQLKRNGGGVSNTSRHGGGGAGSVAIHAENHAGQGRRARLFETRATLRDKRELLAAYSRRIGTREHDAPGERFTHTPARKQHQRARRQSRKPPAARRRENREASLILHPRHHFLASEKRKHRSRRRKKKNKLPAFCFHSASV